MQKDHSTSIPSTPTGRVRNRKRSNEVGQHQCLLVLLFCIVIHLIFIGYYHMYVCLNVYICPEKVGRQWNSSSTSDGGIPMFNFVTSHLVRSFLFFAWIIPHFIGRGLVMLISVIYISHQKKKKEDEF